MKAKVIQYEVIGRFVGEEIGLYLPDLGILVNANEGTGRIEKCIRIKEEDLPEAKIRGEVEVSQELAGKALAYVEAAEQLQLKSDEVLVAQKQFPLMGMSWLDVVPKEEAEQ